MRKLEDFQKRMKLTKQAIIYITPFFLKKEEKIVTFIDTGFQWMRNKILFLILFQSFIVLQLNFMD